MAEKLKNLFFTSDSINQLADTINQIYPRFEKEAFVRSIFEPGWEEKELKEKMRHTTICLHQHLGVSFKDALDILKKAAANVGGFEAMSLPDYVEVYGMQDWDLSLPALGYFTCFASAEFAIRPFLNADPERAMSFMKRWAEDENPKVRRLASEGCRPRLPWAMALPKFKDNPAPIIPVLEKLKDDESESVRRSVANNLNDISKDNPELALDIAERWYGQSQQVDAIVKHACRTLLKKGNKRALLIFGYGDPDHIQVENFEFDKQTLAIGDEVRFSFDLVVDDCATGSEKESNQLRLEYAVDFVKAKGKISRKIFQVIEKEYKPGRYQLSRKHSFVDMTTRKHYAGKHCFTVVVNGEEKASAHLQLKAKI